MPSMRLGLGLAIVVLLAGCAGAPGTGTGTTAETTTTTTAPETDTSTSTTDTAASTTVPEAEITAYSDLTADQQAVFDSLLANDSIEGPPQTFHGLSEEIEYVRYEGTVYHIAVVGQTGLIGENYVSVERTLDRTELADDQPVKNYSELDPDAQTVLRDAIADNDSAEPYSSGELPDVLYEDYVFYRNGTYYRLQIVHADTPLYEIRLERVS